MRNFSLIQGAATRRFQIGQSDGGSPENGARNVKYGSLHEFPSRFALEKGWSGEGWAATHMLYRKGEFCRDMSDKALFDLVSISQRFFCPGTVLILEEGQKPANVLLLLEGRAKLSLNSIDGRRLIIGLASPGEILGLTSVISGLPCEITAEAQFPCMISSLPRQSFLDFLLRSPVACRNVTRQLSLDYKRTLGQLRTLGLTLSAPAKLARLLLDWCAESSRTLRGTQIRCSFTHEEIGELIGSSRETISRCMNDFKRRGLVAQRGTVWLVPDCAALAHYAGISLTPDPGEPAA
jgi:CRP/FNR family transcriptional regulator, cyclic AMP receptor protein